MLITEKEGTKCAEQIVKDFIRNDEAKNIRQTLTELFYEWVQSDVDYNKEQRELVLFHYRALLDFLHDTEIYCQTLKSQHV